MYSNVVIARNDNDVVHGIVALSTRDAHTICGCSIDRHSNCYSEISVNKHTRITCLRCLAAVKKSVWKDQQEIIDRLTGKMDILKEPSKMKNPTVRNMDSGVVHRVKHTAVSVHDTFPKGYRTMSCGLGVSKHNHNFGDIHYDQRVTCSRCLSASYENLMASTVDKVQKPMSEYYYEVHDLEGLVEDIYAETVDKAVEKYCKDFDREERDIEYVLLIEIVAKYIPKYTTEWVKE